MEAIFYIIFFTGAYFVVKKSGVKGAYNPAMLLYLAAWVILVFIIALIKGRLDIFF